MKKWYVIVAVILAFIMISSSGVVGLTSSSKTGVIGSSATSGSSSGSSSAGSTGASKEPSIAPPSPSAVNYQPTPDPPPNQPPIAKIVSIEPNTQFNDTPVNFHGQGYDPENYTKYFSWDFDGDGSWDVIDVPVEGYDWVDYYVDHSYSSPGTYTAILRVKDVEGDYDIDAKQTVIVDITVTITNNYSGKLTEFDAAVNGFSPTNFDWDFGDGSFGSTQVYYTTHTYWGVSEYDATLTVSSNDVSSITYNFLVNITTPPSDDNGLTCDFTHTSLLKLEVTFTADIKNPDGDKITSIYWNFGDGTFEENGPPEIDHLYLENFLTSLFSHRYVGLVVGDEGGHFTSAHRWIGLLDSGIGDNNINSNSFYSTSASLQSVSSSTSYSASSLKLQNTPTMIQKLFGGSSMFSKLFYIMGGGVGTTSFGGDCDLNLTYVSYNPNPPKGDDPVTFYVTVKDGLNVYSGTSVDIHVVSDIPLDATYNIPWVDETGQATGSFDFRWPYSTQPYYVKITAIPRAIEGWNEIDWSDNTVQIDNIIATSLSVSTGYISIQGQSSSQGSYIVGSSESVGIGSTAVQYGSYSL